VLIGKRFFLRGYILRSTAFKKIAVRSAIPKADHWFRKSEVVVHHRQPRNAVCYPTIIMVFGCIRISAIDAAVIESLD
jgi:hypothetical protein